MTTTYLRYEAGNADICERHESIPDPVFPWADEVRVTYDDISHEVVAWGEKRMTRAGVQLRLLGGANWTRATGWTYPELSAELDDESTHELSVRNMRDLAALLVAAAEVVDGLGVDS